ncbi:MAG: hydroxyacid dehydrogenase, partial [Actinobacteria bacterium]|nr:hydroxyacid dehydrogenase [Actinomycetota bacterium]
MEKRSYKIIVLDDDPTGVQTVHNVFMITEWSKKSIENLFISNNHIFYILTNSRSMSENKTRAIHKKIAENISEVSKNTKKDFILISRSDSTLRGHYPLEIETLKSTFLKNLKINYTHEIIIPAFFEGGRYTFNDIHWVKENGTLISCAETEFAKDPQFGYKSSNLKKWVEEKTQKKVTADNVLSISINDIRVDGPDKIKKLLINNPDKTVIVNAVEYKDLEVFTCGCIMAEKEGVRPIFRTAASFVKTRGAIADKEILNAADIFTNYNGIKNRIGLVVVGSFVKKSTEQLDLLLKNGKNIKPILLDINKVFENSEDEVEKITNVAINSLNINKTPVIYTSRELKTGKTDFKNINIGNNISSCLVSIIKRIIIRIKIKPDYLITKGGITSSDIITKALGVKKALVLGQLYPGI